MAKQSKNDPWETRRQYARRNAKLKKGSRGNGGKGGGAPTWLKAVLVIGAFGFVALFVVAIATVVVYRNYADDLVAPDELAINEPSQGARILDRNGILLYEYVDDRAGLRRLVGLEDVSDAFLAATIATEDDNFFTNPGVNVRGLARAAWENSPFSGTEIFSGSGGSSITQQLVKNVYIEEEERQKRSISRKIKETVFAIELTQRYDKDRILEWYVNQISYGGVYNGVEAAAQGYFGKSAAELTLAEAALLAGIPQSPATYNPINNPDAAKARRDEILDLMERNGTIQIGEGEFYEVTAEDLAAARAEPIEIVIRRFPIEAPHFVLEYIQPQLEALFGFEALLSDGLVVVTTLDLEFQLEATAIIESWISEFEETSNSRNGAMMIIDPTTGEILTMIGSRDYFREDIEGKNNNVTACNSPGSSFKPFAYLTTFLELGWGPGTVILDTPFEYEEIDGTIFEPSNPSHDFSGPVTIRNALGSSLNIPANKAALAVGPSAIVEQARALGFLDTFRVTAEGGCSVGAGYGPAIATGGVGVTLEEMVFGFSVFANEGVLRGQQVPAGQARRPNERSIDPISILSVVDAQGVVLLDVETLRAEELVVPAAHTYLITDILSDAQAQCQTFGCGGITIPGMKAGVKTGTSEPFDPEGPNAGKIGETWAFGYTPDIVVGMWAGNADNSPIVNIFSTTISFRTMKDVLLAAYDGGPATAFDRPAGLVEGTVCVPSGMKPTPLCGRTSEDLFVADSLPEEEDTWWQRVRIDARNGLLARPATPSQFVRQEIMLVLPDELLETEEDRKTAEEWAEALELPLAPTETSNLSASVDLAAMIFSPSTGARLSGVVPISGRASSSGFERYRVEFGRGTSPNSWTRLIDREDEVESGTLAIWNVTNLPSGFYTLRLVVEDSRRGDISFSVIVLVNEESSSD